MQKNSLWEKYYIDYKKKAASGDVASDLSYGDEIYSSPIIPSFSEHGSTVKVRWQVMRFKDEFNVFCERKINQKIEKKFIASFSWKEAAFKMALESLLVCSGKLTRKGFSS